MFSIVMPMDLDRLEQFANTKRAYDGMPQKKEFIIPTRSKAEVQKFLNDNGLFRGVRLIPYTIETGFNCSKALNIGVRNAKYDNIVITSPEVMPLTNVLEQFKQSLGDNIICWVEDEDKDGNRTPLVYNGFRSDNPGMYFLAMFQKKGIEAINGWDEEFMKGYAYEDNDFGERWVRAGLPFVIREDIKALHQYHLREETISNGLNINANHYHENTENQVIKCKNGMIKLTGL